MNWWLLIARLGALTSAGGHELAGEKKFHRPMRAALSESPHQGVLDILWYIVTIHFAASGIALLAIALGASDGLLAAVISLQFGAYAALALLFFLRLGGIARLPQWMLLTAVALLAAYGKSSSKGGVR